MHAKRLILSQPGGHHGGVGVEERPRGRLQTASVSHDPQLPAGLRDPALLHVSHRHL